MNYDIFGDKGFLGLECQIHIFNQTNIAKTQKAFDRWFSHVRERIEGIFDEVQKAGRNLENLLAKTVVGLCSRVMTKITSHLLRHLLLVDFGIHIQSF